MKLENCYESETQEFKTSLSELDKGILSLAAMLNKSGKGRIYFGVANDGTVLGLEGMLGQETIKKIGTRVAEQIRPAIIPSIHMDVYGDQVVVVLEAEGFNKPYSAAGEYRIRVGSENKKIDPSVISEMELSNSIAQMET
ncbi:MAG: ATP-binding protein, partial [Spirochaetales bacterium]|nr:ATP-binding protein [Spirochaetales bacterium]